MDDRKWASERLAERGWGKPKQDVVIDDDRETSGFRIVYRQWPEGYDPLSKGEKPYQLPSDKSVPRVGIPKRVARWPSARVSFPAGAERRSMPRRHAPDPRSLAAIVPPTVRRPSSTFGRTVIRFVGSHSQEAP